MATLRLPYPNKIGLSERNPESADEEAAVPGSDGGGS